MSREPRSDPPEVAKLRKILSDWDQGLIILGEVGNPFFRETLENILSAPEEPMIIRLASYCGSEPPPERVVRVEFVHGVSCTTVRRLP